MVKPIIIVVVHSNTNPAEPTVPTGAPQSLEAVAVSSSSIRITWSPPAAEDQNGIIRMYHINVTELPTGTVIEMVAHGDESIEIVNHLHPYYLYECAVAAFTVGLGPPALTQALTNPTGMLVSLITQEVTFPLFFIQFLPMYLRMWWLCL